MQSYQLFSKTVLARALTLVLVVALLTSLLALAHLPAALAQTLAWNTFAGSASADNGYSVVVDGNGYTYIVGNGNGTWGTPVRAYTSGQDAFVAKFDPNGNLVWNTFLGGNGDDYGNAIAVDASGNVYAAGMSDANWGTPLVNYGGIWDNWTAKLDSSGNLQWHTFTGAGNSQSSWDGNSLVLDASGNIYVGAYSEAGWGSPVNAYTGARDGYVLKYNNSGAPQWHTFIGHSGHDRLRSIDIDASGNLYACGYADNTFGSPVNAYSGSSDILVAKFNSSGTRLWHTFLGSSSPDDCNGVSVDGSGNVYISGESDATWGSPLNAHAGGTDVFAAQLDTNGNLLWHTFMGSSGTDAAIGDNVFVGSTFYVAGDSTDTWGSPEDAYTDGKDTFVARLDSSGNLLWHTFLGGSGDDDSRGIAVDGSGYMYVTGFSNVSWGSPVNAHAGGDDAFVAKIGPTLSNIFLPIIFKN